MKVKLIIAVTADGKTALDPAHKTDWTSSEDKKYFIEETKKSGCIVMGRRTFETIGKPLPGRLNIVMTTHPQNYASIPGRIEFTNQPPRELLNYLSGLNFESVSLCGGAEINTLFLKEKLIDEIHLTMEPKIFGKGLNLFTDSSTIIDLELLSVERLGQNGVLLKYRVLY